MGTGPMMYVTVTVDLVLILKASFLGINRNITCFFNYPVVFVASLTLMTLDLMLDIADADTLQDTKNQID